MVNNPHVRGTKGLLFRGLFHEAYEEFHYIYSKRDLDDPNNPFASIAMSARDGNRLLWPKYNRIREFALYKIGEVYHCSLEEFMNYPRDVVEMILSERQDDYAKLQAEQERQAEAMAKADRSINRTGEG